MSRAAEALRRREGAFDHGNGRSTAVDPCTRHATTRSDCPCPQNRDDDKSLDLWPELNRPWARSRSRDLAPEPRDLYRTHACCPYGMGPLVSLMYRHGPDAQQDLANSRNKKMISTGVKIQGGLPASARALPRTSARNVDRILSPSASLVGCRCRTETAAAERRPRAPFRCDQQHAARVVGPAAPGSPLRGEDSKAGPAAAA